MNKKVLYHVATILGALGTLIVSTASWGFIHQPETPEELLK